MLTTKQVARVVRRYFVVNAKAGFCLLDHNVANATYALVDATIATKYSSVRRGNRARSRADTTPLPIPNRIFLFWWPLMNRPRNRGKTARSGSPINKDLKVSTTMEGLKRNTEPASTLA